MRFRLCDCQPPDPVREQRAPWMRWLLPSMRHWSCTQCGTRFLATKAFVESLDPVTVPSPHPSLPPRAPRR